MFNWFILLSSVFAPLYATIITINLNVFIVDARLILKNRAAIWAVLNPISLCVKERVKLSIMSEELSVAENILYMKRTVIIEKTLKYSTFKKCTNCGQSPVVGLVEWVMNNYVCLKCKCGTYHLKERDGKFFKWPFPSNILSTDQLNSNKKRGIKIVDRSIRALAADWNRFPDMSKRDITKSLLIEKMIKELELL